ncbi:hypothetical protein JCM5350_001483 [Sporobolomyces pararoseus]
MGKEQLTLGNLRAIVQTHRTHALAEKERKMMRKGGSSSTPSREEGERFGNLKLDSSLTERSSTSTRKREPLARHVESESPPSSPTSTSTSSQLDSPTRRYSSSNSTKRPRRNVARSLPLLSLLASSGAASSLLSTCESLVQLSPTLSLPDLLQLSRSLYENVQMLSIAQAQAFASGRTFGSSFDTLARLVASPLREPSQDPSSSALLAAKALDLFSVPTQDSPPSPFPTSPMPPPPPPPVLILTTPRTVCRQCESPLTIRTKPAGPFSLISPSEPPRSILVASHVCTNTACRARHSPDHVEISYEKYKVWIWEEEARYTKVGDRVWVTKEFSRHFSALLLQQQVGPGGFAEVWNSLHAGNKMQGDGLEPSGAGTEDWGEDLENEGEDSKDSFTKLSPAHVWRAFVISSSIHLARGHNLPFVSIIRPSSEFLVSFANRNLFSTRENVHILEPHSCSDCSRPRVRKWKSGPASRDEAEQGVKWSGSLKSELSAGILREDTELFEEERISFAVCDGIAMGHFLCAMPSCSNPPLKHTRKFRFCEIHRKSHKVCGIVGCGKPVAPVVANKLATEVCCDPEHVALWEKFAKRREAVKSRGWIGPNLNNKSSQLLPSGHGRLEVEMEKLSPSSKQEVSNTWSLRRVSKVQLLVGSCGTPLAWSKFSDGESPRSVLRFLTLVHAQLALVPSSSPPPLFPSYIAYDRACDVLREAVLSSTPSNFQNPFETPKKRRRNAPAPLPSFLESSRIVVTGFHQQCHSASDKICQHFCNSAPLDGSAPDLLTPYVSSASTAGSTRRTARVFERAFNSSAAEQLNSSLRGFTHLLQGMKAANFDFLLNCILLDKKQKLGISKY